MLIHSIHGKIMLSINTDEVTNDVFQSFKGKYDNLDKEVEGSEISFKFVGRLNIR